MNLNKFKLKSNIAFIIIYIEILFILQFLNEKYQKYYYTPKLTKNKFHSNFYSLPLKIHQPLSSHIFIIFKQLN
jgi:hypothetical protein